MGTGISKAIASHTLDESVANSTAPPTPMLTQYQQFDGAKPGIHDSPHANSIKKSLTDGRGENHTGDTHKPVTPVITEMDLTDQQLTMISKYF